jgi:alpha-galactosidase
MKKPLKIYILAGQSNMVGFGYLSGARPAFPSVFLSADPALIPGVLRIEKEQRKLDVFGIYTTVEGSQTGAIAKVYHGSYDPTANYAGMDALVTVDPLPLGTVRASLPGMEGEHTIVAEAFIEVPVSGTYRLHAGYGESSYAIVKLDGEEVYRKDEGKSPVIEAITLEKGKRYPISITYLRGGSCAFWLEQIDLKGKGDLTTVIRDGQFPWFVDDEGNWTVRNDVIYWDVRTGGEAPGSGGPLSVTSNGKFIGPEVPFGYVVGTYHDEQVLLIESSMGNRSLKSDFRPPSSGRVDPDSKWEGLEYRLMVEGVHNVLANLEDIVPGYQGQGYEIVGFAWFQGHKDKGSSKEEYEGHLVNLIQDLRKEFDAPEMRAVVATVGFQGWNLSPDWGGVHAAQMAVGDSEQHPEFAGKVASIDTRGFWRSGEDSPTYTDYHYNHNAEVYSKVGDALGRAMVEMLGGSVEKPAVPEAPEQGENNKKSEPTAEELAAHNQVIEPFIVDGMLAGFLNNDKNRTALDKAISGERVFPADHKRSSMFPEDIVDKAVTYFSEVGNTDYEWKDWGPALKNGEWAYFSFDPKEQPKDRSKGASFRKVSLPEGMENWFSTDFDAAAAGWETGNAPFGQKGGERVAVGHCEENHCRCGITPSTLWEKEVLLLRKTVTVPKPRPGYRYRMLVGGRSHVNGGDGYELYINGRLLSRATRGVVKREGGQPVGSLLFKEDLADLAGGTVTIGFKGFLRYNHPQNKNNYPPNGHVSLWFEEQKIPPVN